MKLQQFRKLLREEIRRVLKEQKNVLKNVTVDHVETTSPSKFKKLFGSLFAIKKGPKKTQYTYEYIVDLDVEALIALLKSSKDYSTVNMGYGIDVYYKGSDSMLITTKGLPKDVASAIAAAGRKQEDEIPTVSIQISDPEDDFRVPEDYGIPTVIQSLVGDVKYTGDEDDEDAFEDDINKYVAKIEKALLAAGKKVISGMKKYTIEDGHIIFQLPRKLTPQEQSKLKALYKGAKSVDF